MMTVSQSPSSGYASPVVSSAVSHAIYHCCPGQAVEARQEGGKMDRLSFHQARKISQSGPNGSVKQWLNLGSWTSGNGKIEVSCVVPKVWMWSLGVPTPLRDGSISCRGLRYSGEGSLLLERKTKKLALWHRGKMCSPWKAHTVG